MQATIDRGIGNALYSRFTVHNDTVYVTGQVAKNRVPDVAAQTRETLSIIDDILAEAGTDKTRIVKAQVWLKHVVDDFAAMNHAWSEWAPAEALPARATVGAEMAAENILVEISVIAAR